MVEPPKIAPVAGVSELPASAVLPVARKISGTMAVDPRDRLDRIALALVESALQGYRDAAKARAEGDVMGAGLLRDAARKALDTAHDTLAEIEAL